MLAVLLTLTAGYAILTWRNLHTGLLLLVAVLPSYLLRTGVFGIPTTLLELLVVTFLIVWLIKRRPKLGDFTSNPQSLPPVLLLLLAATISVFVAPNLIDALGVWKAYFLEPILLFFVVRYEFNQADLNPENLFKALGITAIILSVVGIAQWLTGAGLPIPWDIERRVTSVFDYPNALGLYLGPILIIACLYCFKNKRPFSPFWLLVIVLSSIAIALAQSEAAIVSVVATLLLAGLLHKKTRILSLGLVPLSILATLLFPPLLQKITLQDYSGGVRLSQWSETVDILQTHWLLGTGLSGYPTALEPYHQATHLEIFQYPHNIILNIWVELGLLGLITFLFLAWTVLQRVATTYNQQPTIMAPFLALLQMSIHGMVDVPYFKNDLAIMTWILIAFILAYARPATSKKES